MKLTRKNVEHVALLARLRLTEQEIELFATQLTKILGYVEKLNELDTDQVEPLFHVVSLHNVFREDKVTPSLPLEKALQNAPDKFQGCFKVPKILD